MSRGGSVAQALFPVFGAEILVVGAKVSQLGAECCHLAREVLDLLRKCVAVGEWHDARERQLGCGLDDAVCTAARGVQVALGLAGENGPYVVW
jgi:hypothetical protein